ncbi:TerC family protein [Methylocapsa palsarum]|uniref:Integral membrane protein, YjbE family n=1 Tax=Methylocapsa palsarum TaxID=1612308 RepID=A0A1I3WZI0_9HYPH|nr:TerC family protein [Methylocapsa palsarum]SFK12760.1 integral membrane protein, YjbE family [Methylocapsa palsarum]
MHPETTAFVIHLVQIIWIDILLSGDNAIVIALACRALPEGSRQRAMWLGAGAAVGMRAAFTVSVVSLMALPFVKIVGGALLLFIAIRLVGEDEEQNAPKAEPSIWAAVRIIVVADLVMSLDNVVAVAAVARGSPVLIFTGLALSIPLIVSGSALVLSMLGRFPVLVWAGAAMLGWIGGEFIASDHDIDAWLRLYAHGLTQAPGPVGAALVLTFAWLRYRLIVRAWR